MNRILFVVLILLLTTISSQDVQSQNTETQQFWKNRTAGEFTLTKQDSILAARVKKLELPEEYKERAGKDLPPVVNNAEQPYFRPIFSQGNYANCGQSSAIAYNFTYETDRARGVPADNGTNQYTPQFTWNFMNGGDGWYGVSYFHSFEILQKVGNPTVEDYGGMFYGGGKRWMSGYGDYHNSMLNRIDQVYAIDVSTIEGINTLKYWLYDHLEGDTCGGVASFYTYSVWDQKMLPEGTPEAGKHVIITWRAPAGHALTIVGYNDSIRYDYNGDGKYTNDIDINDDGIVDLKDWEIGGFIFANSYGENWANSGFCYAMYNGFAYKYGQGGIWNQTVNVLKVKPDYQPVLGLKLRLQHNSRNKLKIVAGVSPDTSVNYPEYVMDFPIVNYQGGNKIMQGEDTLPDADQLALELDISPLLTYVNPGDPARYFVQIVERDEEHVGQGNILDFGLVDYQHNDNETTFPDVPQDIKDNSITTLSVVQQLQFDKPVIVTEELPAVNPDTHYQTQLQAEGGTPPYHWKLLKNYRLYSLDEKFPEEDGNEITFSNDDSAFVRLNLPFPFPFYGDTVHQIYVYIDGFVTFDRTYLPYPYFEGESTMLTGNSMIAPFLCDLQIHPGMGQKVTYESNNDYFLVRWQVSPVKTTQIKNEDFALKIFPSGDIHTYFNNIDVPATVLWTSGISSGDGINYQINHIDNEAAGLSDKNFIYTPLIINPGNLTFSPEGLLEVSGYQDSQIYQLHVMVTDDRNISTQKEFQLSSGLLVSYEISSGDDENVEYGETVSVKASVKNISLDNIENIQLNYQAGDEYVQLIQQMSDVGTLLPGETVTIDSSLVFRVSYNIPDGYLLRITDSILSNNKSQELISWFNVSAPTFSLLGYDRNGQSWLEPGAVNAVDFKISNTGQLPADSIHVKISFEDDRVQVTGSDTRQINKLLSGNDTTLEYRLRVDPGVMSGISVPCHFTYTRNGEVVSERVYSLLLGRTPVLLVNLDPKNISVDSLKKDLNLLNVPYKVLYYLPENLSMYKSVFVLLGSWFDNHELSYNEGEILKTFLNESGNVYMEGRVTWKQGSTPVHPMFGVEIPQEQYLFYIDTLFTVPNDSTAQMMLGFDSNRPYIDYYFLSNDSALEMLRFKDDDSTAVAGYETENYKTIASIVEYGCLTTMDTAYTRTDYLSEIVNFFGLYDNTVGVEETNLVSPSGHLDAYPNPFRNEITFIVNNPDVGAATLQIFDQHGQLVYSKEIDRKEVRQGKLNATWDGVGLTGNVLSKGIYIARLISGSKVFTTKIVRY